HDRLAKYTFGRRRRDDPAHHLGPLDDLYVEVQRELRPARLGVFAGIAVLACNRFTCGNMLIGCLRVCAWSDVPAGGLRADPDGNDLLDANESISAFRTFGALAVTEICRSQR